MIYLFLAPALAVFAYGLWRHWKMWQIGKAFQPSGTTWQRLKSLAVYALGQGRVVKSRYAGLFHALFFAGFLVLFVGTLVVWVHVDFGLRIMQGDFYLYFQSLTLDVFGLLAAVGIVMALARRLLFKPKRIENDWRDWVGLPLLLAVLITGFMIEGLRIVVTEDPWGAWSPVGLVTGKMMAAMLPAGALRPVHAFMWWFHMALVFSLIAWAPFSKLLHIFTSSANIYFRSLEPKGAMLKPIDLDTAETFGVKNLDQFTWKGLLDLDACTECGRCQDACPAYATNKPLSPKKLVLDLRNAMRNGQGVTAEQGSLIGPVIQEETLWACTNCRACMEVCPVFIDHVPKIVDMRRQLVMEEGKIPATMETALRNLEGRGHPFTGAQATRLDWCKDLSVKVLADGEQAEYLFWVGCATALNPRSQKVARAFAKTLQEAGVEFGILGNDEHCTGDAARRMGNEYLFQTMAKQNIDILQSRKVQKIVTTCPHCLNTLKNEYPQFGGNFQVEHHSTFLAKLIEQGKWTPKTEGAKTSVAYHDPCHLGRYNGVYDAPRQVVEASPGAELLEFARNRSNSFCCGAGGGRMWAEEAADQRVGTVRAREAVATGADVIGVACPFCMPMLEEGIKTEQPEGREIKVLDIAELLRGPEAP